MYSETCVNMDACDCTARHVFKEDFYSANRAYFNTFHKEIYSVKRVSIWTPVTSNVFAVRDVSIGARVKIFFVQYDTCEFENVWDKHFYTQPVGHVSLWRHAIWGLVHYISFRLVPMSWKSDCNDRHIDLETSRTKVCNVRLSRLNSGSWNICSFLARVACRCFARLVLEVKRVGISGNQNISSHIPEKFVLKGIRYQIGSPFRTNGDYVAPIPIIGDMYPLPGP